MPGFLHRLFAPRWRHPDPRVRLAAVERLDPERDHATLTQLLDDPDRDVQYAVLHRLDDPREWLRHGADLEDDVLRSRLLALIGGHDRSALPLGERLSLVETLEDHSLLAQLALEGDNQQLRLAALARLDSEDALIEQACHNTIAAVRQAAATRVDSDAGLERLARESRRDRGVARDARARLARRRDQARARDERQQRRADLIENMTRLAQARWEPMYAARLRHLQREWAPLDDDAGEDQRRRFHDAEQRAKARVEEQDVHHRAEQAREQAEKGATAIVTALDDTLERFAAQSVLTQQDIDWLLSQRRLHAERWRELSDRHSPEAEQQQRFEQRQARFSEIAQHWQHYLAHTEALQQALNGETTAPALETLCNDIDWPRDLPLPTLLNEARQQQRHNASSDDAHIETADPAPSPQLAERFTADLDRLESQLDSGDLNRAARLHDSLQQRRQQLSPSDRNALAGRLRQLGARTQELRDWRSFAAAPKRTQLCETMEALADERELDDLTRDQRHRRLVNEWKALGSAAATRETAQRFRSASDHVREQLSEFYTARDALRRTNLAHRQTLCAQIEALLERREAITDPDELRTIRDRAREEWRQYTPVPRDDSAELKRRFSKAMRALQGMIDQRARAIADAKRELIEQARALEQEAMSATTRAEQTKTLQRQWREMGRAPRGDEQALWKEFRRICDSIFAARDEQRQRQRSQQDARLDAMQALIERLDAWQPDSVDDRHVLETALDDARALTPLPAGNRASGMQKRWNGIVHDREAKLEALELAQLVQRWQRWAPLLEAHVRADEHALSHAQATPVELPASLDLPRAAREAHAARNDARNRNTPEQAEDWLAHLRVYLAVLAGAPVARADSSRRLDVQVARLNDGMGTELSLHDELARLQCQLLATGPVSADSWQALGPQLEALMQQITHTDAPPNIDESS